MTRLELRMSVSEPLLGSVSGSISGPPEAILDGVKVRLRGLELGDLNFLHRWENTPEVWGYSDCGALPPNSESVSPAGAERFSRNILSQFIDNQQHDIYITGQRRFVICAPDSPVGFIDLFDFDPVTQSAGVGVLICDPADRGRGYGSEALRLAIDYSRQFLCLHTLWCTVAADNWASLSLFSAAGFTPRQAQ